MIRHSGISHRLRRVGLCLMTAVYCAVPPLSHGASGQTTLGARVGNKTGEGFVSILAPLHGTDDSLLFLNPRFALKDEGETEGNIGLGFRKKLGDRDAILGANVYYDSRKSQHDNRFNQWGAGLEFLSKWLDARINYYDPEDKTDLINEAQLQAVNVDVKTDVSTRTSTSVSTSSAVVGTTTTSTAADPFFTGHNIAASSSSATTTATATTTTRRTTTTTTRTTTRTTTVTDMFFEQFEAGLKGVDAEVGVKLPLPDTAPEVRLFAGYYDFDGPFDQKIKGAKGRLELRAGPFVTVDAEVFEDKELNGTDWFLGARLHFPFDVGALMRGENPFKAPKQTMKQFRNRPIQARLAEDVIRDVRVQTEESEFAENKQRRQVGMDQQVGVQTSNSTRVSSNTVIQENTTVSGDGNVVLTDSGNPITINHVNDSGAAGDGTIETPHGSLNDADADSNKADRNIVYVHSGTTFNGQNYNVAANQRVLGEGGNNQHRVNTDQLGVIDLPAVNGIGNPRPVIQSIEGAAFHANDNSEISNFTVSNVGSGVRIDNLPGNVNVNRITVINSTTGIDIIGGSGQFTFTDVTVTDAGGTGIDVDGGTSTIIFGSTAVEPDNGLFGPGAINQGNNGSAVNVIGSHSGTFVFNPGSTINATNGDGLRFDDADGTYEFSGAVTLNGGDAGIDILGDSNGTFTFANTDITNPTGTAFDVDGGSANVTFSGGSITQANNAITVNVQGGHSGTLNFGVDIDATDGDGLQFDNADGQYNFNTMTGVTTLNGGDAGIDILGNSNGTFTFANIDISNPTGDAFNVTGDGTNSPDITYGGTISNDAGRAVSIQDTLGPSTIVFNSLAADAVQDAGDGIFLNNVGQNVMFQLDMELSGNEGIDIDGGAGTFTFTDTDITDTSGAAGIDIDGGAANISFGVLSSISQNQNQSAVNVTSGHTGNVVFAGDVVATSGDGLQFDNADGTYNFNGTTTLNGGDAGIDILSGSGGTFTFSAATRVDNPTGIGVNIDTGSPNVTFLGDINKTLGQRAIRIDGTTGGVIDFVDGSILSDGRDGIELNNAASLITIENARVLNAIGPGIDINNLTGSFTIRDSTVDNADASGISVVGGNGPVTIERSTISNNSTAGAGGGIFGLTSGTINVINSTISGNAAVTDGGGIFADGQATFNLFNSTVANNQANGDGGGIFNGGGVVNLDSTVVADNTLTGAGTGPDINGTVTANFSLIEDPSAATINGADNIVGQDPQLGALMDNGGPTLTHAIPSTSPASNSGSNVLFLPTDQRGSNRVADGQADIGAFEFQLNSLLVVDDFFTDAAGNPFAIGNTLFDMDDLGLSIFANDDPFDTFTAAPISANGGEVAVNPDGTFVYNPPVAFANDTDSFTYQIMNNAGASGMGTVFIEVDELVWYIDDTASPGGDGRLTDPFTSLAEVNNDGVDPDGPGDFIFVFDGSDTQYDGGMILEDNQQLIGQGVDLVVAGQTLVSGSPAQTPTLTNLNPGGVGIILANDNTVRGLDIGNVSTFGIFANGSNNATVEQVNINNAGISGIDLLGTTGTFTFSNTTINNAATAGLRANGGNSNVTFDAGGSITQSSGSAVNISGGNTGLFTFDPSTNINATGGDGLQFDNADGAYDFQGTTTLNGGDAGIDILTDSGGTFTFGANTSITDPSGAAVNIGDFAAGGNFNYNGSVSVNGGAGLIHVNTTGAGSAINFNPVGANTLVANNTTLSGIEILDADGDVTVDIPTAIDNAGFSAIFVGLGGGTYSFMDTVITNQQTGNAGVDIIADFSTINFTNLDIDTDGTVDGFGRVGFLALPGNNINLFGTNNINSDGGPAFVLNGTSNFDITLNNVTSTNSTFVGPSGQNGISILFAGSGTFDVIGTTTIDNTGNEGIVIDDVNGTFTFANVDISNTGNDGVSVGTVLGMTGSVNVTAGTISTTSGDGIQVGSGIPASGGVIDLNNTTFSGIGGFTTNLTNGNVSGAGNTAVPFSCNDGGGNTGNILFNGGADACPALISDRRLKRDVRYLGTSRSGLKIYAFKYLWSDEEMVGVMAQDLLADEHHKNAVIRLSNGFYAVDYARLEWR